MTFFFIVICSATKESKQFSSGTYIKKPYFLNSDENNPIFTSFSAIPCCRSKVCRAKSVNIYKVQLTEVAFTESLFTNRDE